MTPELRRILTEAEGAGELEGQDVLEGCSEHPVCGDIVSVWCRVQDGVVVDFAWRAEGCPATIAVAAAARSALVGGSLADAGARLRRRLAGLGDLAVHERHAERMLLRAVDAAGEAR